MRAVNFVRGAISFGNSVVMRCARAVGAWFAVDLENGGKARAMLDVRRDSRGSGAPIRSRGRDELTDAPWWTDRLEEGPAARVKLVVGPDAGVLKEVAEIGRAHV